MFQMKTILFPIDFSDACSAAAEQIATTAAHFGAKLVLLHAVQTPPAWYGDAVAYNAVMDLDELREERRKALEGVLQDCDDVEIQRTVAYGDPARAVLECARAVRADLIMMPTHGCGPFRRFLLGSVTAKVLHDAEIPVWTDAHFPHPGEAEPCRCVLCGVDLKSDSAPAVEWASQYAQSFGLELRLVHVLPGHGSYEPKSESVRRAADEAQEALDALERKVGIEAATVVRTGSISAVLRETAVDSGASAIVIGQGSLHKMMGRLRTNAYAIVRDAPCPVVRC